MVIDPIYIVAAALGVSFLIGILGSLGKTFTAVLSLITIAFMTFVSAGWLYAFQFGNQLEQVISTAGFNAPFSISLLMGQNEAFLTTIVNFVGLLGGIYLFNDFVKKGRNAFVVYIVFLMGLNVVIMSRDLFNIFVFIEITSIATAGLILLQDGHRAIGAGFKYMLATSVISSIFLIGIIFIYYYTGTLSIDELVANNNLLGIGGLTAIFLVMVATIIEMKPFPANGWGLDVYDGSHPGLSAVISAASTTASFYVLYKLMGIAGQEWYYYLSVLGALTFIGSNLLGIKQKNAQRLLGYSSIGQMGLLMLILGLRPFLNDKFLFIVASILISHYLAKAGLFWLAGIVKERDINNWSKLRKSPILMVLFGTFIFTLIGFPPFPSFFGKWELIMQLASAQQFNWMAIILIGSFIEGIYLFNWFSNALKHDNSKLSEIKIQWHKFAPPVIFGLLTYALGYFFSTYLEVASAINYIPLLFIVFIALIDFTPAWVKNTISIIGVSIYGLYVFPTLEGDLLRQIFLGIFLGGAVITLFSGYYNKGKRVGFYPMALAMFVGLTMLLTATNLFEILYGWELMTVGSYFLLIRGKKSLPHGYSYLMYSLGGTYLMMFGFALAFASNGYLDISALSNITVYPTLAYSLILLGFMTKTASFGVHTWLPGAHGEAVADIHFMASAILLKAGVFGIIIVLLNMDPNADYTTNIMYVLGWIGAISALVGNTQAVFQESAKKLLAWSSIGQLGYIVFGLAMMSHLGWMAGLFYTVTHFFYKGVLFLIIGGIALKLGTPLMYKMGGLIKKMPLSFIAVLIAIITLAGIPPLIGFGGKWLFYNAILEKGWYLQGALVMFSGVIAFMYLWRLIHTIFLGQLKDNHRNVTELSAWFLIPVYLLLAGIMVTSVKPEWLLEPLGNMIAQYFPDGQILWTDGVGYTEYGKWAGTNVAIIIGGAFMFVLGWLLIATRKAHKIGQFDITYAGERPERPETTHVAYNVFEGLYKAMWIITIPLIETLWTRINNMLRDIAGFTRRIYSGNGQAYMLHIVLFILVSYLVIIGG